MKVTLITGGAPHYEVGLVSGLVKQKLSIGVIGGDQLKDYPIMHHPLVSFSNLLGKPASGCSVWVKVGRIIIVYFRIMKYALLTDSRLFHIQWLYKFPYFDRTLLNLYYKIIGKRLIFTAHNIDAGARDGKPSWGNRFSLRFLYRIVDHIIVHTNKSKRELISGFGIQESKISVIPHGIMSAVPESSLSREDARKMLGLPTNQRVLLFFGLISPYKGLENLVRALGRLRGEGKRFTLVIAGRIKECQDYWDEVLRLAEKLGIQDDLITELGHIPDESVEVYYKAADVAVLPYRGIFQSGVLFLTYRFGLPVIATDVGSFHEDIVHGRTGFVCRADDPADLAKIIETYFASDLFRDLENSRHDIREYAYERYSWTKIGEMTRKVYEEVLRERQRPTAQSVDTGSDSHP